MCLPFISKNQNRRVMSWVKVVFGRWICKRWTIIAILSWRYHTASLKEIKRKKSIFTYMILHLGTKSFSSRLNKINVITFQLSTIKFSVCQTFFLCCLCMPFSHVSLSLDYANRQSVKLDKIFWALILRKKFKLLFIFNSML